MPDFIFAVQGPAQGDARRRRRAGDRRRQRAHGGDVHLRPGAARAPGRSRPPHAVRRLRLGHVRRSARTGAGRRQHAGAPGPGHAGGRGRHGAAAQRAPRAAVRRPPRAALDRRDRPRGPGRDLRLRRLQRRRARRRHGGHAARRHPGPRRAAGARVDGRAGLARRRAAAGARAGGVLQPSAGDGPGLSATYWNNSEPEGTPAVHPRRPHRRPDRAAGRRRPGLVGALDRHADAAGVRPVPLLAAPGGLRQALRRRPADRVRLPRGDPVRRGPDLHDPGHRAPDGRPARLDPHRVHEQGVAVRGADPLPVAAAVGLRHPGRGRRRAARGRRRRARQQRPGRGHGPHDARARPATRTRWCRRSPPSTGARSSS